MTSRITIKDSSPTSYQGSECIPRISTRGLLTLVYLYIGGIIGATSNPLVDSGTVAAQSQTITVRPRNHTDVVNFGNPQRAYDPNGAATGGGGTQVRRCGSDFCTAPSRTITATWYDILDGYRPQKLQIVWSANAAFAVYFPETNTEVTATLEYSLGGSWNPLETFRWTEDSRPPACPTPADPAVITCSNHLKEVTLQPTQSTGAIKVRATVVVTLLSCKNCTAESSNISGTLNVYDVRVIAEAPSLIVTPPDSVTRADNVTFEVLGAPGSTITNWRYDTSDPAVGTVTRTADVGASTWPGRVVASGTTLVNVNLLGQSYPLYKELVVGPRTGWAFAPVQAVKRNVGYQVPGCGGTFVFTLAPAQPLTLTDPGTGQQGAGKHYLCIEWDITLADIGTVDDNGPNHALKWVKDVRDTTTSDWALHPDIDNPASDFYTHQCGNFVAATGNSCSTPAGTGYISGPAFQAGAERHEAGPQNSHHSKYVDLQNDPSNNLKLNAENDVASPGVSAEDFLAQVNFRLASLRSGIYNAMQAYEPCGPECTADCLDHNGPRNIKDPSTGQYAQCPMAEPYSIVQVKGAHR